MRDTMARWRVLAFAITCVCAVGLVVGYIALVKQRRVVGASRTPAVRLLSQPPARPYLVVSSGEAGDTWGRLVLLSPATPEAGVYPTTLSCHRVHMAGGRGSCLRQDQASGAHVQEIFDERFTVRHRLPLTGVPSRTRVSPDGRWAAATVFEHGHSYAEEGYSTRTTIVDTASGRVLTDLEQFAVERDGRRFKARDFNFWGVTFAADSDTFYATLASGGVNHLIVGRVSTWQARVLRTGVECPSLSPDGTRIAYKHLVAGDQWQLWLLDLRTGETRALSSEGRSLDDQVDWLDEGRVLYQMPGPGGVGVWTLPIDGSAAPRLLVPRAFSPSVIR